MIRDLAGRRGSKIVFWGAVVLGLILVYPTVHKSVEWIYKEYTGTTLSWGLVLDSVFVTLLSFVWLVVVSAVLILLVMLLSRAVGWGLYRNEIQEIRRDVAEIKAALNIDDESRP